MKNPRSFRLFVFLITLIFSLSIITPSQIVYAQKKPAVKKEEARPKSKEQSVEELKPSKTTEKREHSWVNIFPIGMKIRSFVIDPHDTNTMYALVSRGELKIGLFKSVDGGKLWTDLSNFNLEGGAKYVREEIKSTSIVIDPTTKSIFLGFGVGLNEGYRGGLWKSKDGGMTWEYIGAGVIAGVNAIAINPKNTEIMYVVSGEALYKTLNGGKTWGKIGEKARWLYLNPDSPEELYVCCEEVGDTWSGVFTMLKHSINGGQSFELGRPYYALDSEGKKEFCDWWNVTFSGGEMLAACGPRGARGEGDANIIKSSDGGKTWELIADKALSVRWNGYYWDIDLNSHPTDKNILYAILDNKTEEIKIVKSTDGGKTWTSLPSHPAQNIDSFEISLSNTIYVTTDKGIFKTVDEGASWESASFGLPSRIEGKKTLLGTDEVSGSIFVNGDWPYLNLGAYWVSKDKGASWQSHLFHLKKESLSQVVTTSYKTTYFVYSGGKVFKVISNQEPIEMKSISPEIFTPSPSNSQILYAISAGKLLKSEDGGFSWMEIKGLGNISMLYIDPQSPDIVYAMVNSAIIKTTDGGKTWMPIDVYSSMKTSMQSIWSSSKWLNPKERSDIANRLVSSITSVVIDPSNSNVVYIVTATGGVYRSDDGGKNWKLKSPMDYLKTLVSTFDDYSTQECRKKGRKDCKVTLENSAVMKSWQIGIFINVPPNYIVVRPIDILNRAGVSFNNISINPSDPKTIYLATNVGVYRSSDRGDTWQSLNNGLLDSAVRKVIASTSLVLAEGESGIYKLSE